MGSFRLERNVEFTPTSTRIPPAGNENTQLNRALAALYLQPQQLGYCVRCNTNGSRRITGRRKDSELFLLYRNRLATAPQFAVNPEAEVGGRNESSPAFSSLAHCPTSTFHQSSSLSPAAEPELRAPHIFPLGIGVIIIVAFPVIRLHAASLNKTIFSAPVTEPSRTHSFLLDDTPTCLQTLLWSLLLERALRSKPSLPAAELAVHL